MWIQEPTKVHQGLYFLGREELPIYLVKGEREAFLIEGGLKPITPLVLNQISEYDIDPSSISGLVILHSHYDHTGAVPSLKRNLPNLIIHGSERCRANLSNPKVLRFIDKVNDSIIEYLGLRGTLGDCEQAIDSLTVEITHKQGDSVELGGVSLHFYEAPGHSDCGMAVYIPQWETLFISDFGGFLNDIDDIFAVPFQDINLYIETIKKLSELDVKVICLGHFGILTERDAADFFKRALDATHGLHGKVIENLSSLEEVPQFTEQWMLQNYRGRITLIPKDVFRKTFEHMVRMILNTAN